MTQMTSTLFSACFLVHSKWRTAVRAYLIPAVGMGGSGCLLPPFLTKGYAVARDWFCIYPKTFLR